LARTFAPPIVTALHLAVVSDFPEEGWHSMDLCAAMLLAHLGPAFQPSLICPRFRRRWQHLPLIGRTRLAFNADRLCNRFADYPRAIRRDRAAFPLFHIVDHSYAHLVHQLPSERTGVYCHDLDTFRCLLEPLQEPRPFWFRALTRHILRGFQKAAVVFFNSRETARQIKHYGLTDPDRLVHAPLGAAPEFTPERSAADDRSLATLPDEPFLLHVGSCIPRKRIDVLLDVFAAVRRQNPDLRLVQCGGRWTGAQQQQLDSLGIRDAVTQIHRLDRPALAALYRRAAIVLQPSEAEGFGLPVLEALACGAVVAASDIAPLHEAGGDGAVYCPVADVPVWADTVSRLLRGPALAPALATRLAQARRFSWEEHARIVGNAYLKLRN
jgi:glycosyltransferase involved in cell wall biosynthesis